MYLRRKDLPQQGGLRPNEINQEEYCEHKCVHNMSHQCGEKGSFLSGNEL